MRSVEQRLSFRESQGGIGLRAYQLLENADHSHLGYQAHCVVDGGKARIILGVLVTPSELTENKPPCSGDPPSGGRVGPSLWHEGLMQTTSLQEMCYPADARGCHSGHHYNRDVAPTSVAKRGNTHRVRGGRMSRRPISAARAVSKVF